MKAAERGGRRLRAQRPHRRLPPRPRQGPGRQPRRGGRRAARPTSTPAPRSSSCPRSSNEDAVQTLVDAFGPQRLTMIAIPGNPPLARLEELGVARVSFGPLSQNVALTALQELVEEAHRGGGVPKDTCGSSTDPHGSIGPCIPRCGGRAPRAGRCRRRPPASPHTGTPTGCCPSVPVLVAIFAVCSRRGRGTARRPGLHAPRGAADRRRADLRPRRAHDDRRPCR